MFISIEMLTTQQFLDLSPPVSREIKIWGFQEIIKWVDSHLEDVQIGDRKGYVYKKGGR